MNTKDTLSQAIARSVSHTERVTVTVTDIPTALAEVNAIAEDYDSTDENPTEDGQKQEDVWGTTKQGDEFRLLLAQE